MDNDDKPFQKNVDEKAQRIILCYEHQSCKSGMAFKEAIKICRDKAHYKNGIIVGN